MKRISSGSLGVDQGTRVLFSDFADGGVMWTGQGPRESRYKVTFKEPYAEVPSVTVSISMWDMDQKTNARADICADNISPTGFDMVFRTWGDSRLARIRADWMSIGPLRDPDGWELY